MFTLYSKLKWLYNTSKFGYYAPLIALISYTMLGAVIFKTLEHDEDQKRRDFFKNESEYAVNQVLDRMLEVRCHDELLKSLDRSEQIRHAQDALFWFLDHLNLTEVIEERSDASPWTWWSSMFYAGQLYTTIGYGFPTVKTVSGQVASCLYIMIGIPIFLIILKDVGRLMSRGLRKFYKRLKHSKIAEKTERIRRFSSSSKQIFKVDLHSESEALSKENGMGKTKNKQPELEPVKQNKINERIHAEMGFPIPIALAILSLWILFSAALFCIWETEWGYLTSVYFFFVSISTVGLGDIYPSKPDMMIFNFILILVGLALLSMCFNLIQLTLERFLDRLLDEYIEEIEKMAEIVHQDDPATEHAIPFEFKMTTGGLLTVPFKKVTEDHGILAEIKSFMAEKVAENLIASRLGNDNTDSEEEQMPKSDEKMDDMERQSSKTASRRSSQAAHLFTPQKYQLNARRPFLKTIQTLEKIRPHKGDFRSVVFSKFVTSDRLTRLVEETAKPLAAKKSVSISCQTEPEPKMRRLCGRKKSRDSVSTVNTCDSVISTTPYKDIYFDYSTDMSAIDQSILNMKSTLSILRIEDEEPILQSKLMRMRSPPKIRVPTGLPAYPSTSTSSGAKRIHRPLRHIPSSPITFETDDSFRDSGGPSPLHDTRSLPSSEFSRLQNLCGFLPNDFAARRRKGSLDIDSPSNGIDSHRSNSSIEESILEPPKTMQKPDPDPDLEP
ncbi:unnamed protein product, partial [Mesorhabditis belari]|uniref:Potassium channel domain-containing protein n=1 Tax=Mesorhabditis belari TaxID=2138241 RepID=A0AAF3EKZ4_9BILA